LKTTVFHTEKKKTEQQEEGTSAKEVNEGRLNPANPAEDSIDPLPG
jgi:hypothetical protein